MKTIFAMNSPTEEIRNFVKENRTGDALSRLLEMSKNDKQLYDGILILSAEFKALNREKFNGTIDNKEESLRLNNIHKRILIALEDFDSEGRLLPGNVAVSSGRSSKFLLKLGMSLLSFALSVAIILVIMGKHKSKDWLLPFMALYLIGLGGIIILGGWLLSVIFNALKGK